MFQDTAKDENDENQVFYKCLAEQTSVLRCNSREWIRPIYTFQRIIRQKEQAAKESPAEPAMAAPVGSEDVVDTEGQEPVQCD